jgi:hypothetical protein
MSVSQTYVAISSISLVYNFVTFSHSVSPDLNCSQAREVSCWQYGCRIGIWQCQNYKNHPEF